MQTVMGMIDLDNGVYIGAACDAPADFMVAFGGNDNRYTAAYETPFCCCLKAHSYGELGGMPIFESDVMILDRGAFGGDGFGGTCFVFTVCGGVFGGDGEASRVAHDFEAVATVGANSDLLCGISGGPHSRGGDDSTLGWVGGFSRGDYLALYGRGVFFGFGCLCRGQRAASTGC